ncbi:Mor transcription activator family protein [Bergeriella denitrificans]|uniref:Putative bacteriophage transcriptional regulator n=1 Tax=Bergeriella denitrificans TaxID=494 RepID=A0A378UC78_BERDE|nr:Mor transcription activator family protein [Bergeriella denitrificans]STZ74810.1 putative bacteriophage transcriptional regulator [Bergeriella denitrificans]STZ83030.1 putative bacteriophage transcriptional regulator [Bergeriella denitrificans]STZ83074.1 putative bacteriophage transcriptional regulator [Bergeriella denitrificans]STZ83110.1 putative bacteriophage transcriptional regulator [Bergeriella denitrificans]
MSIADNKRAAELMVDLEEQIAACLVSVSNTDRQTARITARQVSAHISKHWGGQLLYIPKNHLGKLDERDAEIWRRFDGKNHAELAREFDLTMQQIYKIVRDAAAHHRAKRQIDLFAS